ncbi:hypothetical protein CDL15_Pgr003890 [Punica granatum]|uniref:AAA+ ATPase domain-containing protein n=1 Tax=Punica granatum TaxID=22663 RepID=A0A218XUJ2_PUNGR|nr:hypothetical protein CDL15_Pgr003890 [Punica granatum]
MVTASSTQGIVSLQTRESMLKDIMKALADDTVNRIGVYGVPGIGKTTLLSQVATQAKASKEYVEVVSALGNPEPKRIRPWIKNAIEKATMIAQGENRDNKKDNEGKVKEQAPQKKETTLQKLKQATQKQKQAQEEKKETGRIKNAIEKATMIAQRENRDKKKDNEGKDKEQAPQKQEKTLQKLKQATQKQKQAQEEKKETAVLVLVDDLSYKLDLEDIGIGDTDKDNIKVKLVMTSTSCPLLADEMHCHPVFHLNYLKNDEALKLFENTVGAKLSDPGLQGIANEPVNNSRGLPHLIVAITHELQKNKSTEYWKDALERLKKSDSVKSYLDLNFRHLDKTQEKLLSIISGVDAGEGISDEALLRYGVGLGLFTGSTHTMEAARGQMRVSLDGLRTTSLLLDSGDTRVKVIDVVREAARDQHTLVLQDEKDLQELDVKLCERKMIFLPYPDIQELPRIGECPELEILVLFAQEDRLLPVPDLFSVSIPKLKVLHFSHTCLKPLSSLIRYLKNLQTLCLENCDLEDVRIVRELKKLQVFSLMGSKITRLPREVGELTGLRSLDLSHCSSLEVIEPGSLEGLVQLEELYLEDSFVQWHLERDEQRSNAGISELNKMSRLSNLDILIPDVDMLCEDLPFLGKLDREGFKKLKHLHVEHSPSTHYLVRSTECAAEIAFTVLESLFLENLSNLEKICHGLPGKGSFEKLKVVRVHHCWRLKNLFSLSLLRDLRNLEEIEVIGCSMMQEIVISESTSEDYKKDKVTEDYPAEKEKLTKDDKGLRRIKLENLQNITTFLTNAAKPIPPDSQTNSGGGNFGKDKSQNTVAFFNSQQALLHCLESLELLKLPKLTEIWQDQPSVTWSKLKSLRIEECHNLLKAVDSSNLLMKLESLESLSINDCKSMEEIFGLRGIASGTINKNLPRLHALELEDLPRLRCLWNTTTVKGISGPQNLGSLKVKFCSDLRYLFTSSMAKAMANLRELHVSCCDNMEAIVMGDGEVVSKQSRFPPSKVLRPAVKYPACLMFSPSSSSGKHVDRDMVEATVEKVKDKAKNIIAFPSLRVLTIYECSNMKSFVLSCKREQEAVMMVGDDSSYSESEDDSHAVFFNAKVRMYITCTPSSNIIYIYIYIYIGSSEARGLESTNYK